MNNLVLLVELPPASRPEAVLLAESLPQLIWLTDGGMASVRETRQQLQTLRHGRCRLVGAVLNHEPKPVFEL
jgi:Mrp family chromosome partitioning ATPase